MAGKKHYFGVGGGTRQFIHVVHEDGKLNILSLSALHHIKMTSDLLGNCFPHGMVGASSYWKYYWASIGSKEVILRGNITL